MSSTNNGKLEEEENKLAMLCSKGIIKFFFNFNAISVIFWTFETPNKQWDLNNHLDGNIRNLKSYWFIHFSINKFRCHIDATRWQMALNFESVVSSLVIVNLFKIQRHLPYPMASIWHPNTWLSYPTFSLFFWKEEVHSVSLRRRKKNQRQFWKVSPLGEKPKTPREFETTDWECHC